MVEGEAELRESIQSLANKKGPEVFPILMKQVIIKMQNPTARKIVIDETKKILSDKDFMFRK